MGYGYMIFEITQIANICLLAKKKKNSVEFFAMCDEALGYEPGVSEG